MAKNEFVNTLTNVIVTPYWNVNFLIEFINKYGNNVIVTPYWNVNYNEIIEEGLEVGGNSNTILECKFLWGVSYFFTPCVIVTPYWNVNYWNTFKFTYIKVGNSNTILECKSFRKYVMCPLSTSNSNTILECKFY